MPNKKTLPPNMTLKEASEFWDHNSVADFPSRIVEMDYALEGHLALIPIARDLMAEIQKKAKQRGVSAETLVNLWLQERLAA